MSHKGLHPSNTKDVNRTYVVSACKNVGSLVTAKLEPKLKLQNRETIVRESPSIEKASDKDHQQLQPERHLTLQRRLRTGSIEKDETNKTPGECGKVNTVFGKLEANSGLPQPNAVSNTSKLLPKGLQSANWKPLHPKPLGNGLKTPTAQVIRSCEDVKVLSGKNAKGNDTPNSCGSAGQGLFRTPVAKSGSLEKPKTPKSGASGLFRSASTKEVKSHVVTPKRPVSTLPNTPRRIAATTGRPEKMPESKIPSESLHVRDEAVCFHPNDENEPHKAENCAVTVAVRVRPFSKRLVR